MTGINITNIIRRHHGRLYIRFSEVQQDSFNQSVNTHHFYICSLAFAPKMLLLRVMINSKRYLFRLIVPAFPFFNIYSRLAKITTALGPLCVATSANKLARWDVEVIDENNCGSRYCPKDREGRPLHSVLQKERPADVVGFYGSLTSTIPRLYSLASFYRDTGAKIVAGGKHVENLPEEALENGIDVVVRGDGEESIKDVLGVWEHGNGGLEDIPGLVFLKDGALMETPKRDNITDFDLQPLPDFSLLRYAHVKIYPVGSVRGCNMKCEFCTVNEKTRCATPDRMLRQITHLVETRNARKFFDVSDHFIENRAQATEFCNLIAEYQKKKGIRIGITVQTRLSDARNPELLRSMRKAGIYNICVGFESPIDEELTAMNKGYRARDMLKWTRQFHRFGFFIHGMFIFGYPKKGDEEISLSLDEKVKRFRSFIRKAHIDTAQVLLAVPLPGTELRRRLQAQGRLYPLGQIGWEYYDGQFPLFEPDDGYTPEELQQAVGRIMSWFYHFRHFLRITAHLLFTFPLMVFPSAFTLVTFRVKHVTNAFLEWKRRYFRNSLVRVGGYLILKNWFKRFKESNFLDKLQLARKHARNILRNRSRGFTREGV